MNHALLNSRRIRGWLAFVLGLICVFSATWAQATDYFVSPQGTDGNPGTRQQPFATIHKAAGVLKPGDTCFLRKGVYREVLRPGQSGAPDAPITFANWQAEEVVISGADVLEGWHPEGDRVHSAPMAWSLSDENQVFTNGAMLSAASWPAPGEKALFHPLRATAEHGTTTTLRCDQIPGPDQVWQGAQLWCAGGAAWICWSSTVTGYDANTHQLTFEPARDSWYTPRKGSLFALRGVRRALHAPGQWFYDTAKQRLLLIPPDNMTVQQITVEAKRRAHAIDLSGRSHVHIRGIGFRAGGLRTDSQSSHIVLENLKGRYVSHSDLKDVSAKTGVLILGNHILMLGCDVGYSSASVVTVKGHDNRIINCHIHHGGYGGLWRGTVALSGRRILFSHNTVRHAGRDLINTHGLMESLVQYNEVSDAGWLTKDLGMFYGHNTDFANTVFRYNLVHDNHAEHCAMGIYFDHLSHNAIVHHNVVWNVGMDPIRFNNPSYNNLVFNNTCAQTGRVGTFDHSKREDLFACRYENNLFNEPVRLPNHVVVKNNRAVKNPPFKDPAVGDYRLNSADTPHIGAYALNDGLWRAGCNMENPPHPLPVYERPRIAWMNTIENACFEYGTLEGWQKTDAKRATLVGGNGWGNKVAGDGEHATGTSRYELRLGPGPDGIRQVIKGLSPHTTYTVSAWLWVSTEETAITLGVKASDGPDVSVTANDRAWVRKGVDFTTGPKGTEATVYLRIASAQGGHAWGDNLTLPLRPAHKE
jgi:hypothetical protein